MKVDFRKFINKYGGQIIIFILFFLKLKHNNVKKILKKQELIDPHIFLPDSSNRFRQHITLTSNNCINI